MSICDDASGVSLNGGEYLRSTRRTSGASGTMLNIYDGASEASETSERSETVVKIYDAASGTSETVMNIYYGASGASETVMNIYDAASDTAVVGGVHDAIELFRDHIIRFRISFLHQNPYHGKTSEIIKRQTLRFIHTRLRGFRV